MGGQTSGGGYGALSRKLDPYIGQFNQIAGQYGGMANNAGYLTSQELTPLEQQQMAQVGAGRANAEQTIGQNVREQSAARGLFSSSGAIGQEAAGLAQLDLNEAMQRGSIYGGAQNRVFQGYGTMMGLLGGQQGALQGATGILGQQAQLKQMQNQYAQQQQAGQMGNIMGAGALLAAPFTGGASMGAFGWNMPK